MAINRREMYGWDYSSRTPVSDQTAEALVPDESESTSSPDGFRGCNLLGELGQCCMRLAIESDEDGNKTLVAECHGKPFTESRAEAESRNDRCRRAHRLLSENHGKNRGYR